jgi:hypothetical protein
MATEKPTPLPTSPVPPDGTPDEGHEGATEEQVEPITPPWSYLPENNPQEPPGVPEKPNEPTGDPANAEPRRGDPSPRPERKPENPPAGR